MVAGALPDNLALVSSNLLVEPPVPSFPARADGIFSRISLPRGAAGSGSLCRPCPGYSLIRLPGMRSLPADWLTRVREDDGVLILMGWGSRKRSLRYGIRGIIYHIWYRSPTSPDMSGIPLFPGFFMTLEVP